MTDDFTLTFLGTGTSTGIPVIGCECETCRSTDSRNIRTRSSILIETPETTLLVDSGPDLRQQALRENIRRIDAVLYTHGHLDHVTGFDDLRAFCWHREEPLPMHATTECMATLRTMFAWAFSSANTYRGYVKPDPRLIEGPFTYGKLRITPLPVQHASVETVGFLFEHPGYKSAAYFPDAKAFPPVTLAALKDVDVLVIDSLQPAPHATHFSNEEALAMIGEVKAREAWLIHLGHQNEHATLESTLPRHVKVAYDGLKLSLARTT